MELFNALLSWGNVKKFEEKEVDEKAIGVILYCATHAPSAGNAQEWEFIVIKDQKIKDKISKAAWDQNFLKDAPVIIATCADTEKMEMKYEERGNLYSIQNASFATMNMLLACFGLGLGSCLVQSFEEDKLKKILNLRKNMKLMSLIALGYSAEEPEKLSKIPFENITFVDYLGN